MLVSIVAVSEVLAEDRMREMIEKPPCANPVVMVMWNRPKILTLEQTTLSAEVLVSLNIHISPFSFDVYSYIVFLLQENMNEILPAEEESLKKDHLVEGNHQSVMPIRIEPIEGIRAMRDSRTQAVGQTSTTNTFRLRSPLV